MIVNILNKIYERDLNIALVAKEVGFTYSKFYNLCNGKTQSIKFETLEKLCKLLHCGVEDLLVIEEESDEDYSI